MKKIQNFLLQHWIRMIYFAVRIAICAFIGFQLWKPIATFTPFHWVMTIAATVFLSTLCFLNFGILHHMLTVRMKEIFPERHFVMNGRMRKQINSSGIRIHAANCTAHAELLSRIVLKFSQEKDPAIKELLIRKAVWAATISRHSISILEDGAYYYDKIRNEQVKAFEKELKEERFGQMKIRFGTVCSFALHSLGSKTQLDIEMK